MHAWKKALVGGIAIALTISLGAARGSAQAEPYNLDVIMDLSGPNAFAGSIYQTTLRVFQQYINAHGGVNARPLNLVFHDDQTNPQTAVQLATQVLAAHPVAFFGGSQTASCAAVASLVRDGPVDYCISPGYFPDKGGYAFASSPSLVFIIQSQLRYMRLRGFKRLAILMSTDATGQSSDRTLQYLLTQRENRDLKIVTWQHFNVTDISVAAQVEQIKFAKPDAVISFVGGAAFGTVLRNLNDAGVHLPVFTSSANINPTQLDQYKAFLPPQLYFNGVPYQAREVLPAGALRDNVDAFYDAFKAAGQEVSPGSGIAWDPAWLVVSAIRKLGFAATPQQLRDYLLNLHGFAGVSGTYDFRIGDQHGLTDREVLVVKWDPANRTFPPVSLPGGFLMPGSNG